MSVSQSGFDAVVEFDSVEETGAISGPGGETFSLWTKTRKEIANLLPPGVVNYEGSFSSPAIIYGENFNTEWSDSERLTGLHVTGASLAPDGGSLAGKITITAGDETLGTDTVSGAFVGNSSPPDSVFSGSSVSSLGQLEFTFVPAVSGIGFTDTMSGYGHDAGTIQYGSIKGKVYDYNGNPVSGSPISGTGFGTASGEDGGYEVLAPGGQSADIDVLDGTKTVTVSVSGGQTEQRDFTHPQLTIEVLGVDYNPLNGIPVYIDDSRYTTNDQGRVEIPTALVKDYDVVVLDYFKSKGVTVSKLNEEFVYQLGPDSIDVNWENIGDGFTGVKLEVIDGVTGQPVSNVTATEKNSGIKSDANPKGFVKMIAPSVSGDIEVVVGEDNNRYLGATVRDNIGDGELLEKTVLLGRKTEIGNTR